MTSKEQRKQWEAEQRSLASMRVEEDVLDFSCEAPDFPGLQRICGVDVSFFSDGTYAIATVVVLSFPTLEVLWERSAAFRLIVPYVPGFLAFREVPALSQLMSFVPSRMKPQVVLVDGNGVFHPRGCGSATHLGITVDLPTIGVAKDVLQVGAVNSSVARGIAAGLQPGEWARLCPVAALLKPKGGGKPLVVSPGHRICLSSAMTLTMALCTSSASPEPIRQADLRSRHAVRQWRGGKQVEYLFNPRLRHLERMQELTAAEPVKDPESGQCRPAKMRWQVKATPPQPLQPPQPQRPQLEAPPRDVEEEGSWHRFLFGWMCACMSRGAQV